jgi:hypothetical protein
MVGEHRERASIVGEVADAEPMARDERTRCGREVVEKDPR